MEIYKKINTFIFPSKCISCNKVIAPKADFCTGCFQDLKIGVSGGMCSICSDVLEYSSDSDICSKCTASQPFFDKALYLYEYGDVSKRVVRSLKFLDKTYLAKRMAKLIYHSFKEEIKSKDYILFVPMHRLRIRSRFYNQAALIAKFVSKLSGVPVEYSNLVKSKFSQRQVHLSKKNRISEIRNSFSVAEEKKFRKKNLLILDDVFTTGATINECSRVLKKSGANKVVAITFAKTML